MSDHADIAPGDVLDGKYRILRRIGAGGMGAVFAARRVSLDDLVAIKCILRAQNSPENRARFLREARAAARIRHPNVVQIFDFGGDVEVPYMVMEYLEGPTLASVLRRQKVVPEHTLSIFGQVCRAAEAGHRRGVVHRDLKPGNVILARGDDGREVVKVLDFGLARVTANPDATVLTNPGTLIGTCHFMAPEQLDGMPGTVATDIYALGVLLYQTATGKLPFDGATRVATMMRIAEGSYVPASNLADVSADVERAIAAALSADPSRRPESAEQLAELAGCTLGHTARDSLPAVENFDSIDLESDREDLVTQIAAPQSITGPTTGTLDDAQFVGRAAELAGLETAFAVVAPPTPDSPAITVITGDPGVGKTRLLDEFLRWVAAQGAAVFRGRCFAYEGDRPPPFETFLWMLDGSRETLGAQARPGGLQVELGDDRWAAFATITHEFATRAGRRPLVIGLDDLQWASALELEFLTYIQRSRPTMVVTTARVGPSVGRESELGRWLLDLTRQRTLRRWPLDPLSEEELRVWLEQGFGRVQIRAEDLRRLSRATGGNPHYARELLRQLVNDDLLRRTGDTWVCESLVDVELPESVATLIRARLDTVSEELLATLQMAAVVGEEFRFETLLDAAGDDEDALEHKLEQGVKLGVLSERDVSAGADFRFASPGVREVLYTDLSRRKRRRLHQRVVDTLTALYGDVDESRIAKVLCYHHHAMGDWATTVHWALIAARNLAGRDVDNTDACVRRAREAVRFLEADGSSPDPTDEIDLDILEGELLAVRGQYEQANILLSRAARLSESAGDVPRTLSALLMIIRCQVETGEYDAAIDDGRLAIQTAASVGAASQERSARVQTAAALGRIGEYPGAVELLEPVADLASASAGVDSAQAAIGAAATRELAWIKVQQGQLGQALAHLEVAERINRRLADVWATYTLASTRARLEYHGGLITGAIGTSELALALARQHSRRRAEGRELLTLAEASLELGDRGRALASAKDAESIFLEIDDSAMQGCAAITVGRAFAQLDRQQAGREALRRGRELCRRTRRVDYLALAIMSLGELRLAEGDVDAALELLVSAADRFEGLGSPLRWKAEFALGRAWHLGGEDGKALAHTRRADTMLRGLHEQVASVGRVESPATEVIGRLLHDLVGD